nr:hypothetical protein [Tanacetum cinerariifolium]
MPKRAWIEKDQKWTDIMVRKIDNMFLKRQIMRSLEGLLVEGITTRSSPATTTTTTTYVTDAQLKALIDQGIVDALAARDTDSSQNGEDSHDSGMGVWRQAPQGPELLMVRKLGLIMPLSDSSAVPTSLSFLKAPVDKHPPSPDYVPGPNHPPSHVYVPYVLEPAYPEFMPPKDDEDPEEDDEDPEEDPIDYPTDRDDDDEEEEESSRDDAGCAGSLQVSADSVVLPSESAMSSVESVLLRAVFVICCLLPATLQSQSTEVHETPGHRKESVSSQKDDDEITLAETLVNIKKSAAKDKGKAIMQKSDPSKKIKKKEMIQISLDEKIAQRFYEEDQAHLLMDEEYAQQVQAQWQMMIIIPEQGIHVESLQTKHPIIDWEIYTEGTRQYWKIVRVKLWSLVKKRFSSPNPTKDRDIALWFELKRLFEPDKDDELWKFGSFDLIWRLYDWCEVHHISTRDGQNICMLVEKEYPLSRGALLMMLVQKLQVDEHNETAEELLRKIFMHEERPRK